MATTADTLRGELALERANLGADLEAIGDRVSPGRIVQRKRAATRQRFRGLRDRVMGSAEDLHDAVASPVSGAGASLADSVRNAPQAAHRSTAGNPLAAGLAAFGLGLVVATLIPETEPEQRLVERVQPQLEEMAATAGQAAHDVVEAVKPAAQQAAHELKDSAQQTVGNLKEQATQAVTDTVAEGKSITQ